MDTKILERFLTGFQYKIMPTLADMEKNEAGYLDTSGITYNISQAVSEDELVHKLTGAKSGQSGSFLGVVIRVKSDFGMDDFNKSNP